MKSTLDRLANFFFSKLFLLLLAAGLLALALALWRAQEARNLARLAAQTEARTASFASEAEIRYRGIHNALQRLANRGEPASALAQEDWSQDAAFFVDAFHGLECVAWLDLQFVARTVVPMPACARFQGQRANEVPLAPAEIVTLAPVYTGSILKGFVFGVVDLEQFVAPLVAGVLPNYTLQLSNQAQIVFTADHWQGRAGQGEVQRAITLQGAAVLRLAFAPTGQAAQAERTDARRTLGLGLLLSALTLVAVYFAQNYWALSRLNAARYRELLEQAQLVAVTLDLDGRVRFCNDFLLNLTGWRREEVLGADWFGRFVAPAAGGAAEISLARLLQGDLSSHAEQALLTRSGELRWVLFSHTILRDTRRAVIGLASLGQDVTQRRQAEADIQRLNAELEARVRERTRQLEAANRELEAFSYSVSHDLRAPLRGIDGWSLALLEDYGGQLDAQARGYLDRVRSEAQRMGQLIDDLLNLARLVRAELVRQPVDLSAIAQKLADQLRATAPERQAAFTIQPGLAAVGDPRLIEIALTNLLGNAFKFTAKADQAQITFGQLHLAGERVFFVRDNGAGFDPALAERRNIFSAFQRLHKASEFPGSGVGLATVQRIIHRHGGRIWAEAALGQGATFFFSLERDAGPASGPAG